MQTQCLLIHVVSADSEGEDRYGEDVAAALSATGDLGEEMRGVLQSGGNVPEYWVERDTSERAAETRLGEVDGEEQTVVDGLAVGEKCVRGEGAGGAVHDVVWCTGLISFSKCNWRGE